MYDNGMETLEEFINKHRKNEEKASDFVKYLDQLIKNKGIKKDSIVYKKANITRQHWSAIISNKISPSLNTVLKIVFALELNNHECKFLLKKAGFTLASSSMYALIIRYHIENKIYDLQAVNNQLIKYGFANSLIY